MKKEYEIVICGAGPAGLAPLIYLDDKNKLDDLIKKGVCLIDSSSDIGQGSFKDYKITANSLGSVFFEVFQNKEGGLYNYLIKQPSFSRLSPYLEKAPPLPYVGNLLNDIGKYLQLKIKQSMASDLFLLSTVKRIVKTSEGSFQITFNTNKSIEKENTVVAKNLLLNIGGVQNTLRLPINKKCLNSDDFIRGDFDDLLYKDEDINRLNITLIGGSHSVFSCITRLFNEFNFKGNLNILHRNPIKLYYETQTEAINDGYIFNEDFDVCKLSGRVNRFSGLRYDSFNIGRDILKNKHKNVKLVKYLKYDDPQYIQTIRQSDLVINCTGYYNKSVDIFNATGEKIFLKYENNIIVTNEYYNPIQSDNSILENLYTYGLGSGPKVNTLNGGEKSYNGRIDGVWIYQNEVSPKILSKMNI